MLVTNAYTRLSLCCLAQGSCLVTHCAAANGTEMLPWHRRHAVPGRQHTNNPPINDSACFAACMPWVIRHTLFGGLLSGTTVVVVTKHPMTHVLICITPCSLCCTAAVGDPSYTIWRSIVRIYCRGGDQAPHGHPSSAAGGRAGAWPCCFLRLSTRLCPLEGATGELRHVVCISRGLG
jgi:hypothetical protein